MRPEASRSARGWRRTGTTRSRFGSRPGTRPSLQVESATTGRPTSASPAPRRLDQRRRARRRRPACASTTANGAFTNTHPNDDRRRRRERQLIAGGAGSGDVAAAVAGNDSIDGNGGNDAALSAPATTRSRGIPATAATSIEGQAGTDTMVFNGAERRRDRSTCRRTATGCGFFRDVGEHHDGHARRRAGRLQRARRRRRRHRQRPDRHRRQEREPRPRRRLGGGRRRPGRHASSSTAPTATTRSTSPATRTGVDRVRPRGTTSRSRIRSRPTQLTSTASAATTRSRPRPRRAARSALTLDGGDGNDTIAGGQGAETSLGGDGNDTIDGNRGDDVALLGAGDDTFVWDPGDGSDTSRARPAATRCASTAPTSAETGRPVGERKPAAVLPRRREHHDGHDGVEQVDFNALGGADTVTVNDLTGTDVKGQRRPRRDLGGRSATARRPGDRQRHRGDDAVTVVGGAGDVSVTGLAPTLELLHAEATDQLDFENFDVGDTGGLRRTCGGHDPAVPGRRPASRRTTHPRELWGLHSGGPTARCHAASSERLRRMELDGGYVWITTRKSEARLTGRVRALMATERLSRWNAPCIRALFARRKRGRRHLRWEPTSRATRTGAQRSSRAATRDRAVRARRGVRLLRRTRHQIPRGPGREVDGNTGCRSA